MCNFVDFIQFYIEYCKEFRKTINTHNSKNWRGREKLKPDLESAPQS